LKTKKAIAKALQVQLKGLGFSLVEVLSPCPTNWKMTPVDACKWINEVMVAGYPLGVQKMLPETKKMLIKTVKTVFSGFGGQGVIMMGYLVAMAGMYEEKNVTCLSFLWGRGQRRNGQLHRRRFYRGDCFPCGLRAGICGFDE